MKRTILLTFALLFSTLTFAQNRATFVDETFDGASLPEGWTTSDLGSSNWRISSTTYSGGSGKELMLSWSPEFEGLTRLITTPFDLSGIQDVNISFKHLFDNFKDGQFFHTIGIATSTDGETWNVGWSQEYTTTAVYEVNEVIVTPDMGKENVMFCLFYDGNSHNMDNWFFDDLLIYNQTELDLKLCSIDMPNIVEAGEKEITFTVENLGINTIESIDVEVNVSGWESPITATLTKNIANSEIVQLTLEDKLFDAKISRRPYLVSVNILSVNGQTDQNISNNYIEKDVYVALNKAQRIPMIEHFSSSTCGPCVAVNQQMHPLMLSNEGKFTYTKFPTAGDPYYTMESAFRTQSYGVIGVPNIFIDGLNQGSNYLTQELMDERYNTPAYADIRGAFQMNGNTINITADFMSYIKLENVKAFITINETTTVENTGSNGETEFHHIMMKMLESKYGNTISINAGSYHRFEFSYDMSTTHVEELEDLEVALWLQDSVTKEIYNSHFAYAYAEHCYPIRNLSVTESSAVKTISWEAPEKGNPKGYNVFINGKLVMENTDAELSYSFTTSNDIFTAEVIALYENEKTSVGVAKIFGLKEELTAPQNVVATTESTSAIKVSWNAVENASSYNIYRDDELIASIESTQETTYIVNDLEYNTEYCFQVSALNDETETEKSEKACAKTAGESIAECENSFNIYPNPVEDRLFIETESAIEEISIYTITGVLVGQKTMNDGQQTSSIDVSALNSGIYFVKIKTNETELIRQIIKK